MSMPIKGDKDAKQTEDGATGAAPQVASRV
jgi:hypothetical protein